MVDDEPPERGRGSWTGQHRSGSSRGGRSAARRPRKASARDENHPSVRGESRPEKAVGSAAVPTADGDAPDQASAQSSGPVSASAPVEADAPTPRRVAGAARIPDQRTAGFADDEGDEHAWLDQDAGPVVRPYTLTGGRSRPFSSGLGLLTHVEALYAPEADLVSLQPEHREILSLTRTALSVAELAGRLDLPVGVVRVLVGDLLQADLVSTFEADAAVRPPSDDILQAVIDGLRAL